MTKVASNRDGTLNVPKANKFAPQVGEMAQGYAAQGKSEPEVSTEIQENLAKVAEDDEPAKAFIDLYDGATRRSLKKARA